MVGYPSVALGISCFQGRRVRWLPRTRNVAGRICTCVVPFRRRMPVICSSHGDNESGGRDGCCPRCLLLDGQASLLILFTTVVRRPGNAPDRPEDTGFTDRLASLAIYRRVPDMVAGRGVAPR